jgi:NAD(P)H-dependent FMN reductase
MPFYDEDLEKKEGMPVKAKQFRKLMIQNDVILIASPEYNGSLSGVLKNAIDWASRSEEGGSSRDAFKGKKFAIMSASPGAGGGARGLVHLRAIIGNIGGQVVSQQVVVPDSFNAFDVQGHLKDQKLKMELQQLVQAVINGPAKAA